MKGHALGAYDRRKNGLSEEDKEDIKRLHKQNTGVREIARMYASKCSRRSIQFILFPERLKQMQERNRKNEHWKTYHNREQLTKATREWRRYKKDLFKNKKI